MLMPNTNQISLQTRHCADLFGQFLVPIHFPNQNGKIDVIAPAPERVEHDILGDIFHVALAMSNNNSPASVAVQSSILMA